MKFADWTLSTPAENLACDEALLDLAEQGAGEFLRVWESPQLFAVVGYGNDIDIEVDVEACRRRGTPILRRCTGGGTVVQGPGCLSYALCLQVAGESALQTVTGTNRFVMERIASALAKMAGAEISVQGCTDLAVRVGERWLKFSGNAQRRRRQAVLFHGTILHSFDLPLIADLLRFPSRQPDYRASRSHLDFITNLTASRADITAALKTAWAANQPAGPPPAEAITALVTDRYANDEWIRRL